MLAFSDSTSPSSGYSQHYSRTEALPSHGHHSVADRFPQCSTYPTADIGCMLVHSALSDLLHMPPSRSAVRALEPRPFGTFDEERIESQDSLLWLAYDIAKSSRHIFSVAAKYTSMNLCPYLVRSCFCRALSSASFGKCTVQCILLGIQQKIRRSPSRVCSSRRQ